MGEDVGGARGAAEVVVAERPDQRRVAGEGDGEPEVVARLAVPCLELGLLEPFANELIGRNGDLAETAT